MQVQGESQNPVVDSVYGEIGSDSGMKRATYHQLF